MPIFSKPELVTILLNSDQLGRVKTLIDANNDATLEELQVLVNDQEEGWVSRSTMGRITQTWGITRKKTLQASERHTERVQTLRMEYWQTMGEVNLKNLIFLDKAGSNLAMTRRYARSEKGKGRHDHLDGRRWGCRTLALVPSTGCLETLGFSGLDSISNRK